MVTAIMNQNKLYHEPVMVDKVIALLSPRERGVYVDCTVGTGGHAEAVLSHEPQVSLLLGIDRDEEALALAAERLSHFGDRVILVHDAFDNLSAILREHGIEKVDGITFDFGVSSLQLLSSDRGFGFRSAGLLDMRMDQRQRLTAMDVVNSYPLARLREIIFKYGEERRAGRIAGAIVKAREGGPITTTEELARVVADAIPGKYGSGGIHPATRTFQAVRIEVNDELGMIERCLPNAVESLAPGGRLLAISYHSLEDRIVKRAFRGMASACICPPGLPECVCGRRPLLKIITKKPLRPAPEEIEKNPRSRSGRLRAAERL